MFKIEHDPLIIKDFMAQNAIFCLLKGYSNGSFSCINEYMITIALSRAVPVGSLISQGVRSGILKLI